MEQNKIAVDIIIPVYNGYEDLQLCIPSVKKHTDLGRHRLILINDCSPDKRIAPYLDSLAEENILVFHNEKNLGFSGNVNKGMCMSEDRDVILLNSDTIVTAGWVDKITACASSEESIGTVTPLSNSATLCSVPVMCQDNPVPDSFTVDEYAELVEACSLHRYPRITVAVGFCMYIKRCVIRDIGLFDAETFGRGYGEENDFCNRAEMAGYHHVMCDDTFIYHKGTASFDTEEKRVLLEAHDAILQERYPAQMEKNHLYCLENPDQDIRDNINMYAKLHNGKKNLFYLIHLDFRERAMSNMGGTQIHVRELMESMLDEYNIFVAARDGEYLNVTAYTDAGEIPLRFEIGKAPLFPVFRDRHIRNILEQVLSAFQIDLIHVHHTQDLSLEIYYAAEHLGIPVTVTLHDYYYACPTILLLDEKERFCSDLEENQRDCASCLKCRKGILPQDYLRIWRREHGRALALCRTIIFPSQSARDIMIQYYPEIADKCKVIYHGEDLQTKEVLHAKLPANAQKNPNLTVKLDPVGKGEHSLNGIKGWAYLAGVNNEETELFAEITDSRGEKDCFRIVKAARPDIVDAFGDPEALMCGIDLRISSDKLSDGPIKIAIYVKHNDQVYHTGQIFKSEYRRRYGDGDRLNVAFLGGMVPQKGSHFVRNLIPMDKNEINWFVFGEIGDLELFDIHQDNCFFSGKYKKEELAQLLQDNEIDVVCILPIWPETFCYTVSEAWMNKIPVLGTEIGAIGERIRNTGAGWLLPYGTTAEEILKKLHEIKRDPDDLRKKKEITAAMENKSVQQMCEEYRDLYMGISGTQEKSAVLWNEKPDRYLIFQGLALGNPSVNGRDGIAGMNRLKNENAALQASIDVLKGTTSYRIARKIADANVPFKEELKSFIRRHRNG